MEFWYNHIACLFGDVAQLARAPGSYPGGRGFDPLRRYQEEFYLNFYSLGLIKTNSGMDWF